MVLLTKTDFIQYLNCPKSLWLRKHEPDNFPDGAFSEFLNKLTVEGYEVERYAKKLLQSNSERDIDFQTEFQTDQGLYARADALERTSDGEAILYEIKSSTRVKTDTAHNHIKDACFQKICAERSGQQINRVYLVHLNGEYVRNGDINPSDLLVFADITDEVSDIYRETVTQIDSALELLAQKEINKAGCSCLYKPRPQHCDSFDIFNPNIPAQSIYSLPRLSLNKRRELIDLGAMGLSDIPDRYTLTPIQKIVLQAAQSGEPQINFSEIKDFLAIMRFPLYFFDFETYASAVPLIDGTSPHKHFPVQYSLHILHANGDLTHTDFLERDARLPNRLINQMQEDIGPDGSIVSWHASFEMTQNKEMAKLFPEKAPFLRNINQRMVDLEDIFKTAYVDARFDGSTSIKKVLPITCPILGYSDLDVQNGSAAMEAWIQMVNTKDQNKATRIAKNLLSYCELDTFAMVEIYRFLLNVLKYDKQAKTL